MQNHFRLLLTQLSDFLEPLLKPDQISITLQFPHAQRARPLAATTIAIGLQDVELAPAALSNYWGTSSTADFFGHSLTATISLLVCARPADSSDACQQSFNLLCDALLFDPSPFDILRIWCDKISYDRSVEALTLPCFAKIRLPFLHEISADAPHISSFQVLHPSP